VASIPVESRYDRQVTRAIRATLGLMACTALLAPRADALGSAGQDTAQFVDPSSLQPPIVWKKIPFGAKRKQQMAAYSKRHYGERTWELTDPHVVVEHYTDGPSFYSAWNTFAANSRHLGEMPGVCSHFIVDTDGTIYQLVNMAIRCRHAIGMNWTAIGIEMVGTSEAQILHRRPQLRAALKLTLWLVARFGIEVRNVIGHAETLMSPYHHELYPSWRCLTHSDWQNRDMRIFRRKLKRMATRAGVSIGPRPQWVDPNC
jgi:N-acetylmuramoyl-L-alanine amidase